MTSSCIEMDKFPGSTCGNPLQERTVEPGVFDGMDSFKLSESEIFALSIKLQFPKFSKGYTEADFDSFIEENIGDKNLANFGRLCFPNEFQMVIKCKDIREKLIRLGRTKIKGRTCWISPLSQSEVRGYVHWLPNAIENSFIKETLTPFGEVLFIENQKLTKFKKADTDSRYFALNLKPGQVVEDIPHFTKIKDYQALITIKGRNPCCFHCREVGHRKSECKKYREKLSDYNARMPHGKRIKPRGRRYRPEQVKKMLAAEAENKKSEDATSEIPKHQISNKTKKKNKKAQKSAGAKMNKIEGNAVVAKDTNVFNGTNESATVPKTFVALKALLPDDVNVQEDLSYLEDLVNVYITGGTAVREKLQAFRNKWSTKSKNTNVESPVTDASETNIISSTKASDEVKENPVPVSEKKKKKKKKKKNKKVEP